MTSKEQKRKRVLYRRKKLRQERKTRKFLDLMAHRRLVTANPTPKLQKGFRIRARHVRQILAHTASIETLERYGLNLLDEARINEFKKFLEENYSHLLKESQSA